MRTKIPNYFQARARSPSASKDALARRAVVPVTAVWSGRERHRPQQTDSPVGCDSPTNRYLVGLGMSAPEGVNRTWAETGAASVHGLTRSPPEKEPSTGKRLARAVPELPVGPGRHSRPVPTRGSRRRGFR